MTAIEKIKSLRTDLVRRFPERANVIDGCLASVLASEHVLIIGPPGTAKSAITRAIAQAFGANYFERLLTKMSAPEEVFGPVSLSALENDRFERVLTGKLPEAEIAFIDECFRASSAILNSLLTLINERIYHNGTHIVKCPLITMFCASNDLPDGKDLEALSDRLLMKFDVQYVEQRASLHAILTAPEDEPVAVLTMDELRAAQKDAAAVGITPAAIDGLIAIRAACKAEGIIASDRRWKKSLRLVQASAYLMGETTATTEDLSVLCDILWREPSERPKIVRIVSAHADPVHAKAIEVLDSAREAARKVADLRVTAPTAYAVRSREVVGQFKEQNAELDRLFVEASGKRTKRLIHEALTEINGMIAESARMVSL